VAAHAPKNLVLRLACERVPGVVDQREDAAVAHSGQARHDCRLPVRISGRRSDFDNRARTKKRIIIAGIHQLRDLEGGSRDHAEGRIAERPVLERRHGACAVRSGELLSHLAQLSEDPASHVRSQRVDDVLVQLAGRDFESGVVLDRIEPARRLDQFLELRLGELRPPPRLCEQPLCVS
jgi:hypothetical protein